MIGCAGVVLGVIFVILAEIVLIKAGITILTTPSAASTVDDPPPLECRGMPAGTSFDQMPESCQQWILRHQKSE
jgi:hypothetical protein